MLSKIIVLLVLLVIVWCLLSSFYYLIKEKGQGQNTLKHLTWRVGLSFVLFGMLYLFFYLGWIEPSTPGPFGLKPAENEASEP